MPETEDTVRAGRNIEEGWPSVPLHEIAHALDFADVTSQAPAWKAQQVAIWDLLPDYFRQGGKGAKRGLGGFFAETVATVLSHEYKGTPLKPWISSDLVELVKSTLTGF